MFDQKFRKGGSLNASMTQYIVQSGGGVTQSSKGSSNMLNPYIASKIDTNSRSRMSPENAAEAYVSTY